MPPLFQLLVHFIQHHVGQQWRQRAALRRSFVTSHCYAVHQDAARQIGSHQPDNSGVGNPFPQSIDQDVVIDPVKELFQVHIHYNSPTLLHIGLRRKDGLMCAPARTESVAVLTEGWIKKRLQYL